VAVDRNEALWGTGVGEDSVSIPWSAHRVSQSHGLDTSDDCRQPTLTDCRISITQLNADLSNAGTLKRTGAVSSHSESALGHSVSCPNVYKYSIVNTKSSYESSCAYRRYFQLDLSSSLFIAIIV
jgi:hypothetical protein